jgi:hypothetical protein
MAVPVAPIPGPFLPHVQRDLVVHGFIEPEQPIGLHAVPSNIQLVTFMTVGQLMSFDTSHLIMNTLTAYAPYLQAIDVSEFDTRMYTVENGDQIRVRVYNPTEVHPNFRLDFKPPALPYQGFYKTEEAYMRVDDPIVLVPFTRLGYDVVLSSALSAATAPNPNPSIILHELLEWLNVSLVEAGVRLRLYLFCCAEIHPDPARRPGLGDMNLNAPEGGWPFFKHSLSLRFAGGRRSSKNRRKRTRTRKQSK